MTGSHSHAAMMNVLMLIAELLYYCKTSNISHTLVANKIVDHSDVVGASPGASYIRDLMVLFAVSMYFNIQSPTSNDCLLIHDDVISSNKNKYFFISLSILNTGIYLGWIFIII